MLFYDESSPGNRELPQSRRRSDVLNPRHDLLACVRLTFGSLRVPFIDLTSAAAINRFALLTLARLKSFSRRCLFPCDFHPLLSSEERERESLPSPLFLSLCRFQMRLRCSRMQSQKRASRSEREREKETMPVISRFSLSSGRLLVIVRFLLHGRLEPIA